MGSELEGSESHCVPFSTFIILGAGLVGTVIFPVILGRSLLPLGADPLESVNECSAVSSGRAADGHDDTAVKEPKLMSIGLFLSLGTVFLIKKPIQLITFCQFSYVSVTKVANGRVKTLFIDWKLLLPLFVLPAVAVTERCEEF